MTTALAYRLSAQQKSLLISDGDQLIYNSLSFTIPHYTKEALTQLLARYEVLKLTVHTNEQGEFLQTAARDTGSNIKVHHNNNTVTITANPLVADLASLAVLQQQLLSMQETGTAPEEEIGYLQYAEWQHQLQESEDAVEATAFWKTQYKGTQPVLRNELLHMGQPRAAESCSAIIPVSTDDESLFLTAFLQVIQLLTDSTNFTIGVECHGREFDELSNTIGLLSKVLPFTCDNSHDVKDTLKNLRAFQFYHSPEQLFDYQFGYLKLNHTAEGQQWLQGKKLKCQLIRDETGIRLSFLYDPAYFRKEDIAWMQEMYIDILSDCITQKATGLTLFRKSFAEKVHTAITPVKGDFVDAFRTTAKKNPDAKAVQSLSGSLTYAEMDHYSDIAAANLVTQYNITTGDFVGVMLPEDQWLPVALMAVMKTGAAYVPVDAGNPASRTEQILSDASLKCILKEPFEQLCKGTEPLPAKQFSGEETVCMIYTSGTTGKPKGVMIKSNSLLNYTNWLQQTFHLNEKDASILQASYAYDLGYTSLWGCLTTGATIHIIPADKRKEADWMVSYINDAHITFLKLTPSVCYLLLQAENAATLKNSSLRLVFSGGEKIDINSIQRFASIKKDIQFVNHYGPTETTIGTLYHPLTLPAFAAKPVVGKPISGNEVFIVNDKNELCVPGEKGEILVGGNGVAQGYFQRDELNKEKFTSLSFKGKAVRVYHTGDLGYWMGDGTICLEGRKDNQVKIHGHRVELGEIKRALTHPAVQDIFLKLIPSRSFGEELVCYYLSDQDINHQEWRRQVQDTLPDYMIPAFFVKLDTLPVTANGKADYSRFPDPYQQATKTASDDTLNDTENIIAAIWSEVLGLSMNATSDFFESGGDSIKAIQIVAKLNKRGLKCQLSDIFNYTSVRTLAGHLQPENAITLITPVQKKSTRHKLLPMQEAMYYHYKAFPDSAANHIIRHFRINGALQPALLQQAINGAVQQFDILRLRFFSDEDHHFYATISDDTSSVIETVKNGDIAAVKQQWINQGIDLSAGPVLKAKLFIKPDSTELLWSYHHIIMDGWCFQLIVQQVMSCYEALCMGHEYQWKPYTSFTKYLDWISDKDPAVSRSFWTSYLQGYHTLATIPSTGTQHPVYDAAQHTITLDPLLTEKISQLCAGLKITVSTFMQVAWGILLGKYNNTDDVVFGVTVSGRPYEMEGFEELLGLFINTLPVRINSENQTVTTLLTKTRNFLFDLQNHQYLSLAEIQSCSALKKDLLDHVLVFENYPISDVESTNITVVSEEGIAQVGYPLAIVVHPGTSCIISFMYDRNRYPDLTISKTAGCLLQVLQQMTSDPDANVADIDIVPEQERLALLNAGEPYGTFNPSLNIITAIESNPFDSIALEDQHQQISYGAMQQRVQLLASWLIAEHNVSKGDHVLISLPPSIDLIITILAVLKAGATYIPIDVEYPEDRKQYIATDSQAKLLISDSAIKISDAVYHDVTMPEISGEDIAYIIYTSGSTGKPKGCQVKHSNLQHLFLQKEKWITFTHTDKWILAHSVAFDFSVWEIFGALVNGGSLYIPHRDQVRDTTAFCQLLQEKEITILNQTPSSFYQLTDIMTDSLHLRMIMFGGDALDFTRLRNWLKIPGHGNVALFNLYGITETTVHVTWHQITDQEIIQGTSCIGKPLPGAAVYILNKDLQLCPEGVFGEICVGGDGVSAGYYNKQALTAQRFITHEFNNIYRSGDVGRWLPGGVLEFGGRIDDQVKVRGYRIEPGEIVYRLQEHKDIRQACVIPVDIMGITSLAAYLIFNATPIETTELRSFLAQTLPAHFIPQYFIPLSEFPLTTNGKIDKRKLPLPVTTSRDIPTGDDEIENYLISLWSRELGQSVTVTENFFESGGHSLISFRVINAVQKKYNITLPVIQLYHDPVLKDFAGTIRQRIAGMDQVIEADYIVLKEGDADKTLFFFPPAVGYAIGFGKLAEQLDGHKVIGINFIEENTIAKMAAIVQELQPSGPLVFCGFSAGGSLSYHVAQALEATGRTITALIFLDSKRFLSPEHLQESMIKEIADDYLNDPRAKAVITSPEMEAIMRRRIESSTRFIHQLQDSGTLNADIYYISSEENSDNTFRWTAWQEITSGRVVACKGQGPHVSMLDKEYLSANLKVYREILKEIFG